MERSAEVVGGDKLFQGERLERQPEVSLDGTERVASALASTVDQTWFINSFCSVRRRRLELVLRRCLAGRLRQPQTHRSHSVTCGDTGAARVNFHVGGALKKSFDVPYGQCWYSGAYHHSHGFLGYNNETGQKYSIPYARAHPLRRLERGQRSVPQRVLTDTRLK